MALKIITIKGKIYINNNLFYIKNEFLYDIMLKSCNKYTTAMFKECLLHKRQDVYK